MQSLADYELIVTKLIYQNCDEHWRSKIINDSVLFGELVSAVAMADWQFNGTGTIFGYRKQHFLWALGRIKRECCLSTKREAINKSLHKRKNKKHETGPININPQYIERFLEWMTKKDLISTKQKEYIELVYLQNLSVREAAKIKQVTPQSIYKSIILAKEKINRIIRKGLPLC